jgi:hypothetical protein
VKSPAAEDIAGAAYRIKLGMAKRIFCGLTHVICGGDDASVADNDRSDRYLT